MKILVLVKEVPDAAVEKTIGADGRIDRSGEKALNPSDTNALEAAVQLKEGGADVSEIVAVTVGPDSAARTLQGAVSRGADRSIHLSDGAIAGSDVIATGYALAELIKRESPELVLLGQQSDDAGCYAVGSVVGQFLGQPALSQVSKLELSGSTLTSSARPSTATTPSRSPSRPSSRSRTPPTSRATRRSRRSWVPRRSRSRSSTSLPLASTPRRSALPAPASSARTSRPRPEAGRHDHHRRGHGRNGRADRRVARLAQARLGRKERNHGEHPRLRPRP